MKVFMVLLSAVLLANHVRAAHIIFPGEEPMVEEPSSASKSSSASSPTPRRPQLVFREAPKCARNPSGICSNTDTHDYPEELVRLALAKASSAALSEITKGDEIIAGPLGNRFGGSVQDDNTLLTETAACAASEEIILYPTIAMNTKRDWYYIANVPGMEQGVRVEKCLEEGRSCKIGEGGTVCRQKYIYRKLLAVNDSGDMDADNFRMPSSCVCYIKNDFLLSTRFKTEGRNTTKSPGSSKRRSRSRSRSSRRSRDRRQATQSEPLMNQLEFTGGETDGLTGSPLDNNLAAGAPEQGTAQQSIETEETLNPSDTIGQQKVRYAGEIVVHSNPIVVQKKPPKPSRRRN